MTVGVSVSGAPFNACGASTMSLLSLNCLIDGEEQDKMVTVKIEKTENFAILKKLIKEEKANLLD